MKFYKCGCVINGCGIIVGVEGNTTVYVYPDGVVDYIEQPDIAWDSPIPVLRLLLLHGLKVRHVFR